MKEASAEVGAPIRAGGVVRHQGRICRVLQVSFGIAQIMPPFEPPVYVSQADCEPVTVSLAAPGSKEAWPRKNGGVVSEGDHDA